jgi:uncharacterized protein
MIQTINIETSVDGFVTGLIFGACLVLAGLADPDKIIGALRLKDFHAIRTVIVFVITGTLGTWLLGLSGYGNLDILPAAVLTVLIGGALVGVGLGLTGFDPCTGLACAVTGRIDAIFTVVGMYFGAHIYLLIYPFLIMPMEKIGNFGSITLPQATGTSSALWVMSIFSTGLVVLLLTSQKRPQDIALQKKAQEPNIGEALPHLQDQILVQNQIDSSVRTEFIDAANLLRRWRNFFFIIVMLCLLVVQTSFWLAYAGHIDIKRDINNNTPVVLTENQQQTNPSAEQVRINPSDSSSKDSQGGLKFFDFNIKFEHYVIINKFTNFLLLCACVLYSLTAYYSMALSFAGKLGGLNHISRAFFHSLLMLTLLFPWQIIFGSMVFGALYTSDDLFNWLSVDNGGIFSNIILLMRFVGYWLLVFLLVILAQWNNSRWTKAVNQSK